MVDGEHGVLREKIIKKKLKKKKRVEYGPRPLISVLSLVCKDFMDRSEGYRVNTYSVFCEGKIF